VHPRTPGSEPNPASDLEIRPLTSAVDLAACVALQRQTWGESFADVVPPALLRVVQRLGGVAAGAFRPVARDAAVVEPTPGGFARGGVVAHADSGQGDVAQELVGFVFGLPGIEQGELVHWSDMLAVSPAARDRGLGERLKRWQREQVLAHGYRLMRWTFDPLESRNAWLNLSRLGAICREYAPEMYADMDSPLHAGIGTDRLVLRWELDSPRVLRRLAGEASPSPAEVVGVPLVNRIVREEPDPVCTAADLSLDDERLLVAIPADIQRLKAASLELALAWRAETRAALTAYFERGYSATALLRFGTWSAYLLESTTARALLR